MSKGASRDPDTFFFMRSFPDLESRGPLKDKFYEGELWKRELEQKLMPMIEIVRTSCSSRPNVVWATGDRVFPSRPRQLLPS